MQHSAARVPGTRPTGPAPARRSGLIEQVIGELRGRIEDGRWPVGSRIPVEAELAALTGTSRNTVREAVQSLVHAGVLERRQGSGTYVVAASEMAGAVGRQVARARPADVLEVRLALETMAARLAARRRTGEEVARMHQLLRERTEANAAGDREAVVGRDIELHRVIGRAARNPVLVDLYEGLLDALRQNVAENLDAQRLDDQEHQGLVLAIEAQDVERAGREAGAFLDQLLTGALRQDRGRAPGSGRPATSC